MHGLLNFLPKAANLGLSVKPGQVRLITNSDDPYIWKVLPGKEHLFKKQMSKHSIGAYVELCREVGTSFEAVLATSKAIENDHKCEGGPTFTEKIAELEGHKLVLMQEICQLERQREQAEKETAQLKRTILEVEQRDAQKTELINQYRNVTVKSLEDANRAFETYRLAELTSSLDRGQSNALGGAYTSGEEDEGYVFLK